jgi:hypothetical protein
MLKFVEDLKINSENEESGCSVLCGRDYRESFPWPLMYNGIYFTDI